MKRRFTTMMICDETVGMLSKSDQQLLSRKVHSDTSPISPIDTVDPTLWSKAFNTTCGGNRNCKSQISTTECNAKVEGNNIRFQSVDDALLYYQQQVDNMDKSTKPESNTDLYNICFQPQRATKRKNPCTIPRTRNETVPVEIVSKAFHDHYQRQTSHVVSFSGQSMPTNNVLIGKKRRFKEM